MSKPGSAELVLIRHAPLLAPGRLCGRTDDPARIEAAEIAALRARLPEVAALVTSPALRCRQTAGALWPERAAIADPALWEQDFGAHDGLPFDRIPDLGPMSAVRLADWMPPGGESFADLCARVAPALDAHAAAALRDGGSRALVVHAGVIRAALARVLGSVAAGLAFEVDTLSVTRLRCGSEGPVSVISVNAR
ncbi:histidine phosphatase family protein [Salipiger sp.]|uniref:histidine phosphatase family protein n=1 Tax=Salipiger sp. TaxID=2078585 RepID=UPI003A976B1F